MDIQTLNTLLANPFTFGALLSWILEQTSFFKDEAKSPLAKIGIVVAACLLWSVGMAALSDAGLPVTAAGWKAILNAGLAVAVGSQIFHLAINAVLPGLTDFIVNLKVTPPTVSASQSSTTTVDSNGNTSSTIKDVKTIQADATTTTQPSAPVGDLPHQPTVEAALKAVAEGMSG